MKLNKQFKLLSSLSCMSALLAIPVTSYAATGTIKVKTVEQVSIDSIRDVALGSISGSSGYTCLILPRIDVQAADGTATGADDFTRPDDGSGPTTVKLLYSTPENERCGASPTTGIFTFDGVPDQKIQISFASNPQADVPASFSPQGIYQASAVTAMVNGEYVDGGLTMSDISATTNDANGVGDDGAQEAEIYANIQSTFKTIESPTEVILSSTGKGVLNVGGRLTLSDTLDPGKPYALSYFVNVIYK